MKTQKTVSMSNAIDAEADGKLTHLDRYQMLREETLLYITQIFKTETLALIAIGALYGFLFANPEAGRSDARIWFLPSIIALLGFFRCMFLVNELNRIGKYLGKLEEESVPADRVAGWETYKRTASRWTDTISSSIAGLIWFIALLTVTTFSYSQYNRTLKHLATEKANQTGRTNSPAYAADGREIK